MESDITVKILDTGMNKKASSSKELDIFCAEFAA